MRRREKETPEETKARRRASLLDDLPDVDDMPRRSPAPEPEVPKVDAGPDVPKVDADAPPAEPGSDPFADADIHWDKEQTTFTIRL